MLFTHELSFPSSRVFMMADTSHGQQNRRRGESIVTGKATGSFPVSPLLPCLIVQVSGPTLTRNPPLGQFTG